MNIIHAENLEFSYFKDQEKIINGISITIDEGEFVAIIGRNGSGKSTLANLLSALVLPSFGVIHINGIDTKDEIKTFEIRQTVGMILQNPDNQLVSTIVEDDIAFAPENLGIEPNEIKSRINYALKTVGMENFLNHPTHLLSGGQKQKIAIAGVLAMEPRILIMDEPTAMLDPAGRKSLIKTIKKLNKENKITIVLITHYMDEAILADKVLVINKGQKVLEGSPKNVFCDVEAIRKFGLDVPQAAELVHELNKQGFKIKTDILTSSECINELIKIFKNQYT